MRPTFALLAAALVGSPSFAAPTDASVVQNARHSVLANAPLPHSLELTAKPVTPWAAGSFVRFEQRLQGIPVEQSDVIVNLDRDGKVRRTVGAVITDTHVSAQPVVAATAAIATADALVDQLYGPSELWPSRAELRFWVDRAGQTRLVWAVDSGVAEPFGTYRVFIDATTGQSVNLRATHRHAKANVYPTNPETSSLEEVDLQRLDGDGLTLEGQHGRVVSCTAWSSSQNRCTDKVVLAVPDQAGDYFFTPDAPSADDPFAEVQMYYHLDKVGQYFADQHGFQHEEPIEAIVNFNYDNAFFGDADGDGVAEIAFGQNSRADFGYDGDVVYHEFVHSVFDSIASAGFFGADEYGLDFAPGSLNEGSADLFALVLTGDPKLGEYAGKGFGLNGPVRDLEDDLQCPNNLFGESHEDGKIWGAMGWNMIDDDRVGPEVVGDLIYGVLQSFPPTITWEVAGDTLVTVAGDLRDAGSIDSATHDAIIEHANAAGFPGCERIIPLDGGFSPRLFALYVGVGDVEHIPLSAQFSIEAPEGTTEIRFNVDEWQTNSPNMAWTVFVRRGSFIEHELVDLGFFALPRPAEFDFKVDGSGTDTIVIDADSEVPLEAGETYHFSIGVRADGAVDGFGQGVISTSGEVTVIPVIDEPDPEPEQPKACGCSSDGVAGFGLILPLFALIGLRRRRAQ